MKETYIEIATPVGYQAIQPAFPSGILGLWPGKRDQSRAVLVSRRMPYYLTRRFLLNFRSNQREKTPVTTVSLVPVGALVR